MLPEFPCENIRVVLDGDTTKANIKRMLYRGLRQRIRPNDWLFAFFEGDGETLELHGGEERCLFPVKLPLNAIPMDDVRRISQLLGANHTLLVRANAPRRRKQAT